MGLGFLGFWMAGPASVADGAIAEEEKEEGEEKIRISAVEEE